VVIRGSEEDVLSRFVAVVEREKPQVVVRVTGDCPFINGEALHAMRAALLERDVDIINYQPGHEYADKGLEVMKASALLRAATDPAVTALDREHVTSLLYRQPDRYRVGYVESAPAMRRGDLRLTVDTPADLEFFDQLLARFPGDPARAALGEIIAFLDRHPDLVAINLGSGRKSTLHERARFGFRCDGGVERGLGHVVGSLRLARLLATEAGVGIEFVTKHHPAVIRLVKEAGFALEVLPEGLTPAEDAARLVAKAAESDWSGVVVNFCKDDLDRYAGAFHAIPRAGVPLVFMDNPRPASYALGDVVINALPHPAEPGYDPAAHPDCFDGLEYFIPGPERAPTRDVAATVGRVLIAMGGADAGNLTSKVLAGLAAARFAGWVDVVIGAACPHGEAIGAKLAFLGLRGEVSRHVSDLPERMRMADLGFTALGLTTYEMAYHRLPAVIISGHPLNAAAAERYVEDYGAAVHLGEGEAVTSDMIAAAFRHLAASPIARTRLAQAGNRVGSLHRSLPGLLVRRIIERKKSHVCR